MSPKKSLLTVGLMALGLFGYTATRAAYPVETSAPSGPSAAPASNPTHTVLLTTKGRLLFGQISTEGGDYVVRQNGGPIRVPKAQVEQSFESIEAVYRYKAELVNPRDPDDLLKLARWCLSQNMPTEAASALRAVVALSPGEKEPQAMLMKLEASEQRARRPQLDPGLIQTGAEMTMAAPKGGGGDNRPAEINAAVIARARRDLGVSGLPVIFDLPPAVAVKRAEQFARDVHPLLLAACVKCHNEQHPGAFQLVEVKTRRGPSGDVLRANLDATLRLVDPENPARSELLSSALVPHGNRPNQRPIFRGSNDPRYQIIAAWVNSLRTPRPADPVVPTRYAAPREAAGAEGFAVDRSPGQGAAPGVTTTPVTNQPRLVPGLDRKEEIPPSRFVPGQGMVVERNAPPADEFPAPYMLGGPRPKLNGGVSNQTPTPSTAPAGPSTPSPSEPLPTTATTTDPAPTPAATAKPKKAVKIDVDLLQKAILNRNSGR